MGFEKPLTGAERVARRRAALRAQGLRPRTFWLSDPDDTAVQERARQACQRLWELVDHDEEAMRFAEAMTDELLKDHPY